jgi:hypothetical protein
MAAVGAFPLVDGTHGLSFAAVPTTDPEWLFVEEGYTLAREHELE